ncbi:MAG: DUF5050 domain-containing protein [Spirochaetes bacterium]|nr:DUF5050 domain-containing protein [Spirochaetota bacterium]
MTYRLPFGGFVCLALLGAISCAPISSVLDEVQRSRSTGWLYLASLHTISRIQKYGYGTEEEVVSADVDSAILAVDTVGATLYWRNSDYPLDSIWRASLDGSGREHLFGIDNGSGSVGSIAVDSAGGKLYWSESQEIWRANLSDGSSSQRIYSETIGGCQNIELDLKNGKLYWLDPTDRQIYRANLDGSAVETILDKLVDAPTDIAVETVHDKLYWSDQSSNLNRANLDGSSPEVIFSDFHLSFTLDTRGSGIYYSDDLGSLSWRPLDGSIKERRIFENALFYSIEMYDP